MGYKKQGGPAFPTTKPLDGWGDPNQGMSLRDYFASDAMQTILSGAALPIERILSSETARSVVARDSYQMADAMLKARQP